MQMTKMRGKWTLATVRFKPVSPIVASRVLAHSLAQQQPLPMLPKAPGPAVSSAVAAAALPEPPLRMVLAVSALGLPQIHCSHPELLAAPWLMVRLHVRGISLKRKRQP